MYTSLDITSKRKHLNNKETIDLFYNPIEQINIDKKNGTFWLRSSKVEHLNAIKYQYNFIFNKKLFMTILIANTKINNKMTKIYDISFNNIVNEMSNI
jgi:hypothetical protein